MQFFFKTLKLNLILVFLLPLLICVGCSEQKDLPSSEETITPEEPLPARDLDPDNPPHVVWILLDACRPDFGCYGNERPVSPTIDALAREGALFEKNYAQGLWTMLSVPSYMAGRYFSVSCLDLIQYNKHFNCPREIPDHERLIPEIMNDNGYHTVLVSAQSFITPRSRLYKAFQERFACFPPAGKAYVDFNDLLEPILEKIKETRDKPLFLYVHAMDTHFPHKLEVPYNQWVNKNYTSKLIKDGEPTGSSKQMGENRFSQNDQDLLRALHDGSIKLADDAIAKILETLKECGLYENTLFIIGADHGDALGEDRLIWGHGSSSNEVSHVPLILAGPGIAPNQKISQLTQNVDIMATLIDLLKLDTTVGYDGKSLMPLIQGQGGKHHEYVLTCWTTDGYDNPNGYIIRDEQHVYEYNPIDGYEALFPAPDFLEHKQARRLQNTELLDHFRKVRREKFEPSWQAYDALPRLFYEFKFTEQFLNNLPDKQSWISLPGEYPQTDELFQDSWILINDFLWAAPWRGSPDPMTVSVTVPPECYLLTLYLYGAESLAGHPVTTLHYHIQGEEEIREISFFTHGDGTRAYKDAITIDVPDGEFSITFYPGDENSWSAVGGFVLTVAATLETDETLQDDEQIKEQMRALGYF